MKSILAYLFVCCCLISQKSFAQNKPIDSILLVNYDANYRYMDGFDGTPYVSFLKELLDENDYWLGRLKFDDDEDKQIRYRGVIKRKRLLNKFERLWTHCGISSYVDLSNFDRIKVRMGLKIYRGTEVSYLFVQPRGSDYFDKFMITETREWHASNRIVRFLKGMKRQRRCNRYQL